jgi:hypothetical protein
LTVQVARAQEFSKRWPGTQISFVLEISSPTRRAYSPRVGRLVSPLGDKAMRRTNLLLMAGLILLVSIPMVKATYSVSTDKSNYKVGDTLTVYVCTDGGKIGLSMSGPYTININLGDLPQSCYSFSLGQIEERDVGFWTITMTNDPSVSFWQSFLMANGSKPPSTSFTVSSGVPEFPVPALVLGIALVGAFVIVKTGRRK